MRACGFDVIRYPIPSWRIPEHTLRAGILEILRAHEINCVLDIGANRGQYGSFLREIGYAGRIASFEPVSSTFAHLQGAASGDSNWKTYQMAAGAADGEIAIHVTDGDQLSSVLPMNDFARTRLGVQTEVVRTENVRVTTVDSILPEVTASFSSPRIYLKMDTQGFDLHVLKGAAGSLPLIFGLQSEISLRPLYDEMPDYLTALRSMNSLGYSITAMVPVSRDENKRVIEFDCLMVRDPGTGTAPA
jgi:FkbM family methyltransferase